MFNLTSEGFAKNCSTLFPCPALLGNLHQLHYPKIPGMGLYQKTSGVHLFIF